MQRVFLMNWITRKGISIRDKPERHENSEILRNLTKNPPEKLEPIITTGIYTGHVTLS